MTHNALILFASIGITYILTRIVNQATRIVALVVNRPSNDQQHAADLNSSPRSGQRHDFFMFPEPETFNWRLDQ